MKKTSLATTLFGCILSAHAADAQQSQALDPVIVTATRTAITVDEALSSVSVITRADIERLQPTSLQDLLTGLPGVAFANSGGLGQQTSLFLRGSNSTHTLLLIDGVRMGSVSAGLPAFEQIPVEQIERIELVRGPRSSLYGADAMGGVIQIFTRHGQADGRLTPSFGMTGGSRGYFGSQAGLSGGDAHSWFNVSLGGQYTSGINACKLGAAEAHAGCFADEPDHDASRNDNGSFNGGHRWDNGTELAVNWLRSKSDVEYDGSPYSGNQAVNQQDLAGARLGFHPLEPWQVTFGVGQSRDQATSYYQGTYRGIYGSGDTYYPRERVGYAYSRRNQASWQNDVQLAPQQLLTLGLDYQQEYLSSDTGYLDDKRDNIGGYAQYQGNFGRNEVQLALRRDHNQQFGDHRTGSVAWGHGFDHGLQLSASWGSAFHAPTFNDLYYPFGGGNPNLKPEKSRSAELGLAQRLGIWNWAVNAYQTSIQELITLDRNYLPTNIGQARIRGVEGQLGTRLGAWRVQGYLTWQQPRNESYGDNQGKLLARRPQRTARVDLDRPLGAFAVGATVYAASHRFDDVANADRIGGYSTTDLRASWAFAPTWRVQARLANAFDRRYETAWYYRQPGRAWFLSLRYDPVQR